MRLEAKIKMGYYPTPLSVVERIRSFLKFPEENVNLFDPCCGEGLALEKLKGDAKATTYGIELDEYRAEQAKSNLDHVIKGSYEDARVSNNAFSCLFLNPPYDWDIPDEDERSERKEKTFLKGTVRYLQPSGVIISIIPQGRLSNDIAKILSYRFEDFNVFRFPDDEYEEFKQIVLLGSKKQEAYLDDKEYDRLKIIPEKELLEIPFSDKPIYDLPPSGDVHLFRSSLIDEEELENGMEDSILWQKIEENAQVMSEYLGRPPLPLHKGHLGLLLANGCLDGVVGEDKDRHVVRGKVEKVISRYEEYEGDTLIERDVESYRVSIKILKKDGDIITLM
jgi:16S rRNA G966 N2-methylase RsmD